MSCDMSCDLIQLTPYYPPQVSGVGDHAFILDREFRGMNLSTRVIVHHPLPTGESEHVFFEGAKGCHLLDILAREQPKTLLLHYVCYGYQIRGVPFYLPGLLKRAKARFPNLRVLLFFHELNAFGPITGSAFWLSGLQLKICKDLYRLADQAFVNCKEFHSKMIGWGIHRRLERCEVYSTLGEPGPSDNSRKGGVLLGSAQTKVKVFRHLHRHLPMLKELGLDHLTDIGSPVDLPSELEGEIGLNRLGVLPEGEASEILSRAEFGILCYESGRLGKSSVYAAYLAHGCRVFNLLHPKGLLHEDHQSAYDEYENRSVRATVERIISYL